MTVIQFFTVCPRLDFQVISSFGVFPFLSSSFMPAISEKIPDYEKIAFLSSEALMMQTRHDKALVNKSSTTIKANLKLVSSNKNLSDETRRRADLYIKRINILLEWFRSIIDMYYNIKIQKAGTARVILRKLYNMPRK